MLIILTTSSFISCSQKQSETKDFKPLYSQKPITINENNGVKIWGVPNTLKVMRNGEISALATDYIVAESSKGENEGAQFLITPSKDVAEFKVEISELKNQSGKVIPKENISIYLEKYVEVTKKSNGNNTDWPSGFYPDALLPFGKAVEYGENKIAANENQGIWINFDIPASQEKGVYSGNVNIEIGSQKTSIDIFFKVFDFVMLEDIKMNTNAYTRHEWIIDGELDNTDEMYQVYYDFLLEKYNISSTNLPGTRQYDKVDPKEFVKTLKKYINNPKFTGYNLPAPSVFLYNNDAPLEPSQKFGGKIDGMQYGRLIADTDYEYIYSVIKELAIQSNDKEDLLEPAYLYLVFIDEAGMNGSTWEVGNVYTQFKNTKKKVVEDLLKDDSLFFEKRVSTLKKSIENIPSHVTTNLDGLVDNYVDELIPLISHYNSAEEREAMNRWKAEKEGRALWAYEAWIPMSPFTTMHIDDSMLAHRSKFWMMKKYDIEGYLYWGTAGYRGFKDSERAVPVDVYKDARTFDLGSASPNGDGFFLYPGEKYGIKGPISSIRLEALRDGIEDFQYLYMLEDAISEASKFYGVEFKSDEILNSLYDSIFTGAVYNPDITKIINARTEIALMIEGIKSQSNSIIKVNQPITSGETAYSLIDIYTKSDSEVSVSTSEQVSKEKSGSGTKYTFKKALTESRNTVDIKITSGSYTFEINKYVAAKIKNINTFSDEQSIGRIGTVGKNITISPQPFVVSKRKVLRAALKDDAQNPTKNVGFRLDKQKLFSEISFKSIDSLEFDVFVSGNEYGPQGPIAALGQTKKSVSINVELVGENSKRQIGTAQAIENEWSHIKIGQIFSTNWKEIDKVSGVLITISNSDVASFDKKSIEIYLDDLFVSFAPEN